MSFLMSMYFSNTSPDILTASFIAEVKKYNNITLIENFRKEGFAIHQLIEEFFKNHEVVTRSRHRLNKKFYKNSSYIINVFYNHFLAKNWEQYSHVPLEEFAIACYTSLQAREKWMPYRAKFISRYLKRDNWLKNYSTISGIHTILKECKSTRENQIILALEDLIEKYAEFRGDFEEFFPQLIKYMYGSENSFNELLLYEKFTELKKIGL